MSQLEVGQKVPDFTLPSSSGELVSLQQYLGKKLIIYFYPADLTPSCTQESCDFRDANGAFDALNATVLGISPNDLKSHHKFIAKYDLPFELLSDPDHRVSELFGVWQLKKLYGKEYMGVVRSTFLIDEQGILVKEWRKVKVKNHVTEVLQAAEE
ncbi:thioredoxin-dependent thiol peroxidase [Paenibacillus sp. WQ 127069]|uniref:thioredoxin-dependent peroxiredoxin n=1 Tax=Paenibacillus baimaensis TaxID=2982185 RepID=A0ABT2UFS2_9BACL|nr:thioredoxin-dependent thiol peroxidase [Paenibacillus sp. WQ 127069]MCU6793486.1 thioredoxin-dependent thiol peroxidase [Paenibacillus sp. WQ 127069]